MVAVGTQQRSIAAGVHTSKLAADTEPTTAAAQQASRLLHCTRSCFKVTSTSQPLSATKEVDPALAAIVPAADRL